MNEIEYNYSQDIHFVVGHAGTGKSTRLVEEVNKLQSSTIVLTPTHKAKDVLEAKGLKNVFTIHSVLKLVPTLDMNFRKKGKLQRLVKMGAVDLASIDTIVIDEYSMIPTHILDLLLDLLPSKARVTIYGDGYQLEPVDGDPIDPHWYTDENKVETLITQYRAEAPEVVETFTRFVEYLSGGADDLRINKAIKQGSIEGFNPATDRALAYTNAETIKINNTIAESLNLPKEISIGEQVSINGLMGTLVDELPAGQDFSLTIYPACVSKGRLLEGSKLESKLDKIEHDMNKFNQQIVDGTMHLIEIEGVAYSFWGDLNHYANDKAYKEEVEDCQLTLIKEYELDEDIDLKDWCRMNKNQHTKNRGRAWATYLSHQNLTFDLRRPFATTIHKAQGSEFDTVYIAQDDIKKSIRGGNYTQYARLMYVALSRAIKKVVII